MAIFKKLLILIFCLITSNVTIAGAQLNKENYKNYINNESEYFGLINLKLNVNVYNILENRELPLRNGYVFVNTISRSESGNSINGYYKTDNDGAIYITTSYLANGAETTLYMVNGQSSQINLNCKLAKVDNEYQNFYTVPYPNSDSFVKNKLMLRGDC